MALEKACALCKIRVEWFAGYYCFDCRPLLEKIRANAINRVSQSVARGLIPPAAKLKCVDCGSQAQQYDHRDYGKPLKVKPVCRKCNSKRGPAKKFGHRGEARMLEAQNGR